MEGSANSNFLFMFKIFLLDSKMHRPVGLWKERIVLMEIKIYTYVKLEMTLRRNTKSELINNIIYLLVIRSRGFAPKESANLCCWLNCFEEVGLLLRRVKNNWECSSNFGVGSHNLATMNPGCLSASSEIWNFSWAKSRMTQVGHSPWLYSLRVCKKIK